MVGNTNEIMSVYFCLVESLLTKIEIKSLFIGVGRLLLKDESRCITSRGKGVPLTTALWCI